MILKPKNSNNFTPNNVMKLKLSEMIENFGCVYMCNFCQNQKQIFQVICDFPFFRSSVKKWKKLAEISVLSLSFFVEQVTPLWTIPSEIFMQIRLFVTEIFNVLCEPQLFFVFWRCFRFSLKTILFVWKQFIFNDFQFFCRNTPFFCFFEVNGIIKRLVEMRFCHWLCWHAKKKHVFFGQTDTGSK